MQAGRVWRDSKQALRLSPIHSDERRSSDAPYDDLALIIILLIIFFHQSIQLISKITGLIGVEV